MDYHRTAILNILRKTHNIFYKYYHQGNPIFVNDGSIGTAAVGIDKTGKRISYYWEQSYWDSLTDYERAFVICHEMLHLIFEHFKRSKDFDQKHLVNYATDCVINEMLVTDFEFDSSQIRNWEQLATFDKIFEKDYPGIDRTYSFEYYYNLLLENADEIIVEQLDNHEAFKGDPADVIEVDQGLKDAIKSDEATHGIKPGIGEGQEEVYLTGTAYESRVWQKAIRRWSHDCIEDDVSQWIKVNRRMSNLPSNVFLPSHEVVEDINRKPEVYVFWDVSDSCRSMVEPFRKAILSIPKDKMRLKYFVFDDGVRDADFKNSFKAFGGTNIFAVQQKVESLPKHPDHVWVISDGEFNYFYPKLPERWSFFIGGPHAMTAAIPAGSHIYQFEDFKCK